MRKLILASIGVGAVVVSFFIGRWWGSTSAEVELMEDEMRRYDKFADLDRSVLPSFQTRSNVITSGAYLMDVCFQGLILRPVRLSFTARMGRSLFPLPTPSTAAVAHKRLWLQELLSPGLRRARATRQTQNTSA